MTRALAIALAFTPLAVACAADAGAAQGNVVARLQECGFVTDGVLVRIPGDLYIPDSCYDLCLAEASCGELGAAICGDRVDLGVRCDQRCAFRCLDGSLIGVEQQCDGNANCSDGYDERDCGPVDRACQWASRCDGVEQCEDGRDEHDCPPRVDCGDGVTFPAYERCNGRARCVDESDEAGCADLVLVCSP